MRISNEERTNLLLGTEVDHVSGGFMALISDTTFRPFHLHAGVGLAQLACRVDIGEEGVNDHLNRLTVQGKTTLSGSLQFITFRPPGMLSSGQFVAFHTAIPHLCSFHLRSLQSVKLPSGEMIKPKHTYGFHAMIVAWIIEWYKWENNVPPNLGSCYIIV